MMDWQTRPSPNPRAAEGDVLVGRGFAYMRYKQAENYVAIGMTVAVNKATGRITVRRIAVRARLRSGGESRWIAQSGGGEYPADAEPHPA